MSSPSILDHRVTQACYMRFLEMRSQEEIKFDFNDLIHYVNYKLNERNQVLFSELEALLKSTKPKNIYDFLWFESISDKK